MAEPRTVRATIKSFPNSKATTAVILYFSFSFFSEVFSLIYTPKRTECYTLQKIFTGKVQAQLKTELLICRSKFRFAKPGFLSGFLFALLKRFPVSDILSLKKPMGERWGEEGTIPQFHGRSGKFQNALRLNLGRQGEDSIVFKDKKRIAVCKCLPEQQ